MSDAVNQKDSAEELSPGTLLDSFEIIRLLGRGGMGDVYLCRSSAGSAAVKLIARSLMSDHESKHRFFAEASALKKIKHGNVVGLIEYGELKSGPHSGRAYIAMEYIEGLSLHRLARSNRVTLADALKMTIDIADGLTAVHNEGIIHRDIKPANAMMGSDGRAKLLDLGIAKPSLFSSDQPSIETQTGMIIGTINYIAPELLAGQQATVQSDIYALGLFVWELLNGTTPFKAPTVPETIRKVTSETLTWNQTTLDLSPPGLIRFLNSMLAKTPNKRPLSGRVVSETLTGFLSSLSQERCMQLTSNLSLELSWPKHVIRKLGELSSLEPEWPYLLRLLEHSLRERPLSLSKDHQEIDLRLKECLTEYRLSLEKIRRHRLLQLVKTQGHQIEAEPTLNIPSVLSDANISQSKSTSDHRSRPRPLKIMGAVAISTFAFTLSIWFYNSELMSQSGKSTQNRSIAALETKDSPSTQEPESSSSEADTRVPQVNEILDHPELAPGLQLKYSLTQTSDSIGRAVETELNLVVEESSEKSTVYRMNGLLLLNVPKLLFAGDFFTDSNFADDIGRTHFEGSTEGLYPPQRGRALAFSIVHNLNGSRENIQCVVVDQYRSSVTGHTELEIECARQFLEISRLQKPVLRRKHLESYVFDATQAVVLRSQTTVQDLDESGGLIGTTSRTRKLQTR